LVSHRLNIGKEPQFFVVNDVTITAPDGLIKSRDAYYYYFDKYEWNLRDFRKRPCCGNPRRFIKERIESSLIENSQFSSINLDGPYISLLYPHFDNYYHLYAEILPALLNGINENLPFLVSRKSSTHLFSFLNFLKAKYLILEDGKYAVSNLLVPTTPFPLWSAEKLKRIEEFFALFLPTNSLRATKSAKIYISRAKARRRLLQNEERIIDFLQDYGFTPYHLEDLDLSSQVTLFRTADQVIAPHGAGLINILHSPKETKVLEARPTPLSGDFCFDFLALAGGWQYAIAISKKSSYFSLDLNEVKRFLNLS
jgi:capsular polysaccharide biosynthesis protein